MNRNEITLQEMFSSVIGELREGGMPSLQLIIRKMEILPAVFIKLHWETRQMAMLFTI